MTDIFRNIAAMAHRFKTATAISLVGMTLAYTICYLLLSQIDYQAQYNHSIKDYESTYVVETNILSQDKKEWTSGGASLDWPACEILSKMPEIENIGVTFHLWGNGSQRCFFLGDSIVKYPDTKGNNTLMSTITDKVVDGNIQWNDDDQEGIIIPASIAKQYFGTTKAAGKKMICKTPKTPSGRDTLMVRGVYKDFPLNSMAKNCIVFNAKDQYHDDINWVDWCAIIRFKQGMTDTAGFIDSFRNAYRVLSLSKLSEDDEDYDLFNNHFDKFKVRLIPIEQFYFERSADKSIGNRKMLPILWLLFLLVIIIASINFMNFTLAESSMRVRNHNIRRVMGASRRSLMLELIAECVILSVTACLLAILLCQALSLNTTINNLFNDNITIIRHWRLDLFLIMVSVIVGLIIGTYPARFTISFPLEMAMKRRFELTPQGNWLRRILICIQLSAAMIMIVFMGTLFTQYSYIVTSDYGYDVKQIIHVKKSSSSQTDTEIEAAIQQDILQIPGVENMAFSFSKLSQRDSHMKENITVNGKGISVETYPVYYGYMQTMGIDIIEGRDFLSTDSLDGCCIINKAAQEQWDWVEIGKPLANEGTPVVIGVCDNIRHGTTRINNDSPVAFWLTRFGGNINIQVRTAPDADQEAIKPKIAEIVKRHTGITPDHIMSADDMINEAYFHEFRFIRQMLVYSLSSIIIMLIGVFCLTFFESEFRRKEIGIRKVVGATSLEIVRMFYNYYGNLILISFAISIPLAYLMSKHWLDNFAEHAPFQWWLFPLSLMLVGATTLVTEVLQCWRAAHENPVDSIKDE